MVAGQLSRSCLSGIVSAAETLTMAFRRGNKLLLCGNGGSAADCQHLASEFVNRLSASFERPALPALALTTDTSVLTASANDYGYERVFARQVEALGRAGDVLMCISTSGSSPNVLRAAIEARARGLEVVALTGSASQLDGHALLSIRVPSANTQVVQQAFLTIEHAICDLVERSLYGSGEVPADR